MKHILIIISVFLFSLAIISCSSSDDGASTSTDNTTDDTTTEDNTTTTDTTAPVIAEVTAVTTPTNDTTPDYTFSSTEAGTISYGGSCSSNTSIAISGNNTITLNSLSDGTYTDCTIVVRGTKGYLSNSLKITSFIVDSTAATLVEVTAVTTPTNDNTPDYTFSSSEAGTITYGGSCSSSTTSATTDNNTITLVSLSDDTYSDCTITVTDNVSNSVTLNMSSFVIDTTAPTISSISPTDNQSGVSISTNISVNFSEVMDNTSVTTNTDNTTCYGSFQLSSDNFSSCVQMNSSPIISNSNQTFTLNPSDNLTLNKQYQIRVTTDVKDSADNTMTSAFENSTGFTTYGRFVAVGISGQIFSSTDGNNWDLVIEVQPQDELTNVNYNLGKFVVIGYAGKILNSTDGYNWTTHSLGIDKQLWGITFGNNQFVVVGDTTKIYTSPDGVNWTERSSPKGGLFGVFYGHNLFIAVGINGALVSSTDGINWTARDSGEPHKTFRNGYYANNTYVVVGEDGYIITSSNGIYWTTQHEGNQIGAATSRNLYGIVYANNLFVVTGGRGTTLYSSNGTSWSTEASITTSVLYGVAYRNNLFVTSGGHSLLKSSDGINWSRSSSYPYPNGLYGITFSD